MPECLLAHPRQLPSLPPPSSPLVMWLIVFTAVYIL